MEADIASGNWFHVEDLKKMIREGRTDDNQYRFWRRKQCAREGGDV